MSYLRSDHAGRRAVTASAAASFEAAAARAALARQQKPSKPAKSWALEAYTYRGEVRAGQRHGLGTTTFDGGDVFQGTYVDDKCCGPGVWTQQREFGPSTYNGCWLDDSEHGPGRLVFINGRFGRTVVTGNFVHGEADDEDCCWTLEPSADGEAVAPIVHFKGECRGGWFIRGESSCAQ